MSTFSRWQSGTALLMVLGMSASTAAPLVLSAPAFAQTTNFPDVQSDYWAKDFIQALATQQIIKGFPDGGFRPDAPVTRAEFAAMILKAFEKPGVRNAITFVDVPSSNWAFSAIEKASTTGFLQGYPGAVFRPNENIPRAQVLVSLANGLDYSTGSSTATVLQAYNDASDIPEYARNSIAAATEKRIVVNHADVKLLNPNRTATRAEVAAFIYQALASTGKAQAISSNFVVVPSTVASTPVATPTPSPSPSPSPPPQAKDDTVTTSAGKPVPVPVLANDTAPEVANLKISDVTDGSNGTVTVPADKKSVTYTPKAGFSGPSDSFTYTISDAMGMTSRANVAVSFKQVVAPKPQDDTATTSSGKSVLIPVLTNDIAGEGTSLTVTQVTLPGNGSVAVAPDKKSLTYTPKAGVAGLTDKFIYTVANEAGGTATANVAVIVGAASPLSARADTKAIPAGKPVTIDVLANDSAPAGTTLTISAVTPARNGKVAIANAGKSVVYTPNPGFAGTTDSFSYTVSDGKGNTAVGIVTVTVELAALDAVDDTATVQQGKPVIIDVLGNDRAPTGTTLRLRIDKKPANGKAKITSGNTITYTPKKGIAAGATDSFSYTIEDAKGGKATANVTVTVTL